MDELTLSRAFVQVVESGSISAAARRSNTSVTSIARQVNGLETLLGVRLLNRTTRRQSLTEAGELFYSKFTDVLRQVDDIKRDVSSYQSAVKGCLRVHLRISIGNQVVVPALPRFLAQHPELTLDVRLTDERSDLIAEGVDVAVWLGKLEDSGLIARRLGAGRRVICGSPAYLERYGIPKTPQDLERQNCLVYRARDYDNLWRLTRNGQTIEIPVSGNLRTDSSAALLTSALQGLGLAVVQQAMARDAIEKRELIPVLTEYDVSPTRTDVGLYAVYPHSRRLSPKTRVFIDFLVELFEDKKR